VFDAVISGASLRGSFKALFRIDDPAAFERPGLFVSGA
jgi:hypothetical protein